MASPQSTASTTATFPNGHEASVVRAPVNADAAQLLAALGLSPGSPVILLTGGADGLDENLEPRLSQMFGLGIVRSACRAGAVFIDGGTDTGVMSLLGRAVGDRGKDTTLIGVAPAARVAYGEGGDDDGARLEPHHSHFVLVEGESWGDETDAMYTLADALSAGQPVVTVLVNGGAIARQEVLRSMGRGWPILVLEGSGRLADELAAQWREKPASVADSDVHLFPPNGTAESLEKWTTALLRRDMPLRLAWERMALFDSNASRQQSSSRTMQLWILSLGVMGTLMALSQSQFEQQLRASDGLDAHAVLGFAIVLIPIAIAALTAVANRFYSGNSWAQWRRSDQAGALPLPHPHRRLRPFRRSPYARKRAGEKG